jgi:hypothetical protein
MFVHFNVKRVDQLPGDVGKGPPEFRARRHVHERIVDAVQEEKVPHVRPRQENGVAVTFEFDAPVQGHGVRRDGERAQPKGQDVDGHVQCCPHFQSVDFRLPTRLL